MRYQEEIKSFLELVLAPRFQRGTSAFLEKEKQIFK